MIRFLTSSADFTSESEYDESFEESDEEQRVQCH
jgi:hypothetical protein